MKNITLIGTLHDDPQGPDRLKKLLYHIRPDILTAEFYDGFFNNQKSMKTQLIDLYKKKGISEKNIKRAFAVPESTFYEIAVSQEYAALNTVPFYGIDEPVQAKRLSDLLNLEMMDALKRTSLTDTEFEEMLNTYDQNSKDKTYLAKWDKIHYDQHRLAMSCVPANAYAVLGERDKYMHKWLKALNKRYPSKEIVHVVGAMHTVMPPKAYKIKTLKSLMPSADVCFLPDADKI